MAVVFMNCSIVYWRPGRVGRALCATDVPGIMLARASSGRVRRRYEGGRRTRSSGGGRSNLAVFRPPWSATLCPSPSERSLSRKPSCRVVAPLVAAPATGGAVLHSVGRLCTRISRRNNGVATKIGRPGVASGMQRLAEGHDHMATETRPQEQPRRRPWDRRRDLGRRMVRDRRRETLEVQVERRRGTDRRASPQRRARGERRTPPQGFRFLDQS